MFINRLGRVLFFVTAVLASLDASQPQQAQVEKIPLKEAEEANAGEKNIIFLSSYGYDWVSVPEQIEGLKDVIGNDANIRYFFMDTKHLDLTYAENKVYSEITESMKSTDFDGVIAADDAALDFCIQHHSDLFPTIPVVYEGINDEEKAKSAHETEANFTGIIETHPLKETIQLAKSIQPEAEELVAIVDNSISGIGDQNQLAAQRVNFPELTFKTINTSLSTSEEIKTKVQALTKKTILLFMIFSSDADGVTYPYFDGIELVADAASIPVFKADEIGIGQGIFGGCVVSFKKMGQEAGQMLMSFIRGEKIPSQVEPYALKGTYLIDRKKMDQFGVDNSKLPSDAVILNDRTNPFVKYATIIYPTIIILVLLVLTIVFMVISIMRKKKAASIIKEKESEMALAMKNSGLEYWNYYPEKHQVDVHDNVSDIKEIYKGKAILDNFPESIKTNDFVYKDDVSIFLSCYQAIDKGAKYSSCEYRVRNNGKYVWHKMSLFSLYDENGKRTRVLGTSLDISKQKEAEERYNSFAQSALPKNGDILGYFRLDITKNLVFDGNSRYPDVLSAGEKVNVDGLLTNLYKLTIGIDKNHHRVTRDSLAELYKKGTNEISYDCQASIDNQRIWTRVFAHMSENPSSGDIEAFIYAININEQMILKTVIDDSVAHDYDFLAFIEADSDQCIFYSYVKTEDTTINRFTSFEKTRLKMLEKMNFQGEDKGKIEKETDLETVKKELEDKDDYFVVLHSIDPEGKEHIKRQRFSYLSRENHEILLTQSDITEVYLRERKNSEALQKALKDANAASEAKSMFLSNVSHDMRTPLNGIIGFAALAAKETNPTKKDQYLSKIQMSGQLLLGLINDTLELSRIERGKLELKEGDLPFMNLLGSIIATNRESCRLKGIDFVSIGEDSFSGWVRCDQLKIQEIVLNLLSNAVKFTPQGHTVTIRQEQNSRAEDGLNYIICVSDTGIGISQEFLSNKLYEPFMQERDSSSSNISGTGLGLSIVKKLVDFLKGRISVTSKKDEGTTFKVELPLLKIEEGKTDQKEENKSLDISPLVGKKVLLVEDNKLNMEIAEAFLKSIGIQVEEAFNGKEGIEKFSSSQEGSFFAVLMDVRMPIMDGIKASENIRKLDRKDSRTIPIIAMTANAFEEDKEACFNAGMNGFLTKPLDSVSLFRELLKHLK
jgi:signal transduction histidine kinase/ABC-type uncharacterized transport system substrate-binding protein/PAS domain-containing protein